VSSSEELLRVSEQVADHLSRIAATLEEMQDTLLTRPAAPAPASAAGGGAQGSLPVALCSKTEDGRFQYAMPEDAPKAKCKKCGEAMWWIQTRQGKNKPMDADGFDHRDSCSALNEEQEQVPF